MVTKLLYIEDDPTQCDLIKIFISRENFEVLTARDGISGLELAQTAKPDLILLDINLPHMNGIQVATFLREIPEFANTPIIALTSNMKHGAYSQYIGTLFNDYLTKPILRQELLDRLHAYVSSKV